MRDNRRMFTKESSLGGSPTVYLLNPNTEAALPIPREVLLNCDVNMLSMYV